MTDADFLSELVQMVTRRASSMHLVDTIAFAAEVAERLEGDPVFGEYIPVEYQATGSRNRQLRLHGYIPLEESDGSLGLILAKWSDLAEPETISSAQINQLSGWLENFISEAVQANLSERITESNPAYALAEQLKYEKEKISRIRLHILTNHTLSQRFKEEVGEKVCGIPIERHVWDLQRLKAIYESSREREAVEISLGNFGVSGIPFLEAASDGSLRSYLCVVKANLLADLFERYGARLLEGNVRSFLGMKGGVNKGIKSTIQDSPGLFFAYNNGIAATASNVKVARVEGVDLIVDLVDLQIVNGGQTTASILNARKKDGLSLEHVTVQMKLTQVSHSASNDLIPKIAEYANTQNKVAIADFFANHPLHRKMEEISRRLPTPTKAGTRVQSKWFYERARGQYQNERLYLSKSKKDLFDAEFPNNQVINKTELAKYDSTWNCKPFWTSLGAQKNFGKFAGQFISKNTDISESEYWETMSPNYGDAYFQRIVSLAILWKAGEDIVQSGKGSWYSGDYRPQIVAYLLARTFHEARMNGLEIDLQGVWDKQAAGGRLVAYMTEIAKVVQDVILTLPEGKTDVGEWCKKDDCWENAIEADVPPINSTDGFVIGRDEFRRSKSDGKKQGLLDDAIVVQKSVLELTQSGYWSALLVWPKSSALLSASDRALVVRASTVQGFTKIALEKDWRKLLQLRDLMHEEGFR